MKHERAASATAELIGAERRNLRLGHENLGSLSRAFGFVPAQQPRARLPRSHRAWDDVAAQLPQLIPDMAVQAAVRRMPVLPAGPGALPDAALLRAATVLGVLGHAYGHMSIKPTGDLPASIAGPWAQVRHRLGRDPAPVLSYADLIVNNWRTVDTAVELAASALRLPNLRLLVPTVDNQEEHVFYLTQLEILARCSPVVVNVARANDAVRAGRWDDAAEALHIIETVLIEVNRHALNQIDPRAASSTFVDPVVWAKTVAPFAVPLNPGSLGPSGTASPVISLLDGFFGRDEHASQLGREILAHRQTYPPHWQRFITVVGQTSMSAYLAQGPRELLDRFAAAREAYAGPNGFLGRHRRKVYGYLSVAFTVGRDVTIGGFSGSPPQRRWNDVDAALSESQTEREPAGGHGPRKASATSAVTQERLVTEDTVRPLVRLVDLINHNDPRHGWWVAVDGRAYDVTTFVRRHPGGSQVLQAHAGLDATEAFRRAHRNPNGFAYLRQSLCLGCLERPTKAQSLWLEAAYALVELQNSFRLDRSFGERTRLCEPAGTQPSTLQIDRASDTFDRFHDQLLPDFIRGVLPRVPSVGHTRPFLEGLALGVPTKERARSAAVLHEWMDALERWMATMKSDLLAGLVEPISAGLHMLTYEHVSRAPAADPIG